MLLGGFKVRDDKSEVRIYKLKMADPIWRSHTQYSIIFLFSYYHWPKNYYSGIFETTKDGCKWDEECNMAAMCMFFRENLLIFTDEYQDILIR